MEQKTPIVYNNKRFKVINYNFDLFVGPAAGERFKDFSFTDLDSGKQVKLSDFLGKWVVLETGSSTCSMYTKNIPEMKEIEAEFPDVQFLLIYVREAHPGERLGPHRSMKEKLAAARLVKPRYGEHRKVLVDNLEGDFHSAYGSMPNVIYIIRADGTVHYRSNWAAPQLVRDALRDRVNFHRVENADMAALRASRKKLHMIRTMWTGGFIALFDFFMNISTVIAKHANVDAYYRKHGRFKNQLPSETEPRSSPMNQSQQAAR